MAEHVIIAQDRRDRPTKSFLVTGPDVPSDEVVKQFYEAKAAKVHPHGMPFLALWSSQRGVVEYSFAAPGETNVNDKQKSKK